MQPERKLPKMKDIMKVRHIEIEKIGTVLFERSDRARRINITVRPVKGVRVAVPRGVSFDRAREFVNTKISWIGKSLEKTKALEERRSVHSAIPNIIDRVTAEQTIIGRLHELAKMHGFTFNKVCIRNQRTRWGSCSAVNNINLNMKLFLLPDELRDYVILHELLHTRIKNHGPGFWSELNLLVSDAKELRSRLKAYEGTLL